MANCGYRLCSKKLKMHQKQLTDASSLIPEPLVGFQAAAWRPGERRNEWWKEKEERKEELEFDSKLASWKIPLLACPYAHTCRWTDKSKTMHSLGPEDRRQRHNYEEIIPRSQCLGQTVANIKCLLSVGMAPIHVYFKIQSNFRFHAQ